MSNSMKQERTICVLLPNKDQLDITFGVGLVNVCSRPLDYRKEMFNVGFILVKLF